MEKPDLIATALEARKHARVPYSHFAVGAAVLAESGRLYKGCNIENISLRLTLCAEEVAVGAAVAAGETQFISVAVVADSQQPILPCGGWRPILAGVYSPPGVNNATVDGRAGRPFLPRMFPRPHP